MLQFLACCFTHCDTAASDNRTSGARLLMALSAPEFYILHAPVSANHNFSCMGSHTMIKKLKSVNLSQATD